MYPREASVVSTVEDDLHANLLLPHFPMHLPQQGMGAADREHVQRAWLQQDVNTATHTAVPSVPALDTCAAEPLGGLARAPQHLGEGDGVERFSDQGDQQKLASNGDSSGGGVGDGSLLHAEELLGAIRQRQQRQWAKQQEAARMQDELQEEA